MGSRDPGKEASGEDRTGNPGDPQLVLIGISFAAEPILRRSGGSEVLNGAGLGGSSRDGFPSLQKDPTRLGQNLVKRLRRFRRGPTRSRLGFSAVRTF